MYTDFMNTYGDTNAYAFHNFYPCVVRTLINAFQLNPGDLILDPFNGSGTMTHEATLMDIDSVGVDVTPMGAFLANLKNDLPFLPPDAFEFNFEDFAEILTRIEKHDWPLSKKPIEQLMLAIYFDTMDALARTSRYKKKGSKVCLVNNLNISGIVIRNWEK